MTLLWLSGHIRWVRGVCGYAADFYTHVQHAAMRLPWQIAAAEDLACDPDMRNCKVWSDTVVCRAQNKCTSCSARGPSPLLWAPQRDPAKHKAVTW